MSMSFRKEGGSKDGEVAAREGRRLVIQRLSASSVDSIFPGQNDTVCRPTVQPMCCQGGMSGLS